MDLSRFRHWLRRYGRYAVGVIALAWLFSQIELSAIVGYLGTLSPATIASLVAISILGYLSTILTWHVLFSRFGRARFTDAASVTFSLAFLNLSLPSRLPSTILNPVLIVQRTDIDTDGAVAITILHSTLFAGCYAAVTGVGIASGLTRFPRALVPILAVSGGLYLLVFSLGLAVGYGFDRLDPFLRWARRIPFVSQFIEWTTEETPAEAAGVRSEFVRCLSHPSVVPVFVVGWGGGLFLASGLRLWVLFEAGGFSFAPIVMLPIFSVTAYAITILPISVGGLGVAEVSASFVFVSLGVPLEVVAPAIFLDRFFGGYLPGLLGLYPTLDLDVSGLGNE